MSVVSKPLVISLLISLVNIFSISVADTFDIRAGLVITGCIPRLNIKSRKYLVPLFESCFNKFILKSPQMNIVFLIATCSRIG